MQSELNYAFYWGGMERGVNLKKKNAVSFVYFIHLIWHLLVI